jgi:type IV pilus assembly protein PilC
MSLIVTPRQLTQHAGLYQQLASLLTAGIGILQALETIGRSPPTRSLRPLIARAAAEIQAGSSFTEALAGRGHWPPPFDLALLQAGEQSGRLPECCRLLAEHYRQRAQLARQILAGLAYPLFVLHFAVLIFPTSQIVELLRTFDLFAFVLQKLMLLVPAYAVVFLLLLAGQGQRGEPWRALVEWMLHRVPVLGAARRSLALARLAAALEALINAGVSILDGWGLATAASGSPALGRAVAAWKPRLDAGETPGELVGQTAGFPELFANLYHTGEVSGRLDESLRQLHAHYLEEGGRKLQRFAEWLPRLVYLVVALAVAYQVVAFWTGYYSGILQQFDF